MVEPILAAWGEQHSFSKLYAAASDMLANPDIDIIDVCTPNTYHTEYVVAALNAGKHVIYEKPLALTPDGFHKMIETRDQSGKIAFPFS